MSVISNGIVALVLAAGRGRRMGDGKLLLPIHGRPMLLHALDAAASVAGIGEIVLITGHDGERIRQAVREKFTTQVPLRVVENPDWEDGQSTSLRAGIAYIGRTHEPDGLDGVLVVLGDQPLVKPETISSLINAHLQARTREPGHLATAPECEGRRGNPVVVSPELFPAMMRLEGDVGARRILADLGGGLLRVPVSDPGVLHDVDTPEDYADAVVDS